MFLFFLNVFMVKGGHDIEPEALPFVKSTSQEVTACFKEVTSKRQHPTGHYCYTKLKAALGKDL